jgi:hypothetical protein
MNILIKTISIMKKQVHSYLQGRAIVIGVLERKSVMHRGKERLSNRF